MSLLSRFVGCCFVVVHIGLTLVAYAWLVVCHDWLWVALVGWLGGWVVGWLLGWLVGWLVSWVVGWLSVWYVLVGWLVGWLAGWLAGWVGGWVFGLLRLVARLAGCACLAAVCWLWGGWHTWTS